MSAPKPRLAVYTGSFDPITLGHMNVIERASRLVDTLVVGIGINVEKEPWFSPQHRVELVTRATAGIPNLDIRTFDGLAVTLCSRMPGPRHGAGYQASDRYCRRVHHDAGQP